MRLAIYLLLGVEGRRTAKLYILTMPAQGEKYCIEQAITSCLPVLRLVFAEGMC